MQNILYIDNDEADRELIKNTFLDIKVANEHNYSLIDVDIIILDVLLDNLNSLKEISVRALKEKITVYYTSSTIQEFDILGSREFVQKQDLIKFIKKFKVNE